MALGSVMYAVNCVTARLRHQRENSKGQLNSYEIIQALKQAAKESVKGHTKATKNLQFRWAVPKTDHSGDNPLPAPKRSRTSPPKRSTYGQKGENNKMQAKRKASDVVANPKKKKKGEPSPPKEAAAATN